MDSPECCCCGHSETATPSSVNTENAGELFQDSRAVILRELAGLDEGALRGIHQLIHRNKYGSQLHVWGLANKIDLFDITGWPYYH
jgi:hypothetical protein